jgi:hypothetical protein
VRYALALLAILAVPLLVTDGAGATRECDGLDICISARGPWVAVPAARPGALQTVYYRLSCPRRSVVGGLDAVLGDRSLDVRFLGALGSPVNPGITTGRHAVFVATYAGRRPTAFQPLIGCIPTSGGGGGGTTFLSAAVRPPQPPVRRVRTLRVAPGAPRGLVVRCRGGERLVASSHAVGFRMRREPSVPVLAGATAVRREQARSVAVRASRGAAVPGSVRVEVQVHAICARSAS